MDSAAQFQHLQNLNFDTSYEVKKRNKVLWACVYQTVTESGTAAGRRTLGRESW